MKLSDRRIRLGRLQLYIEPRDLWVGAFVDPEVLYVCPLPCLVARWTRTAAHPARSTVAQPEREKPWMPSKEMLDGLPDEPQVLLISPVGTSHLMLDADGQWWHLQADGQHRQVDAGQATHLRPSDVGLIIKTAMLWSWRAGSDSGRATSMVDELSAGVQKMVTGYALMAGHRPRTARPT